jgi:hypothetical protein
LYLHDLDRAIDIGLAQLVRPAVHITNISNLRWDRDSRAEPAAHTSFCILSQSICRIPPFLADQVAASHGSASTLPSLAMHNGNSLPILAFPM